MNTRIINQLSGAVVGGLLAISSGGPAAPAVSGETLAFQAQNWASGVPWAPSYSESKDAGKLIVGLAGAGNYPSTQLRFGVSALNGVYSASNPLGVYSAINSVTLRLTLRNLQVPEDGSTNPGGIVQLYRLSTANARWNNRATFGWMDGINNWAGGMSGARVPGTDYITNLLASVEVPSGSQEGLVFDLVIPGELATEFINQWSSSDVIVQGGADNFIAFEAESRVTLNTAPLTIWAVTNEVTASGASALWAGGDNQTGFPSSFAIYSLAFAKAGTYTVYYRWRADQRITDSNNTGGNSFRLPVNFGDLPSDSTSSNFVASASNNTVPASNDYVVTKDAQTYTVTQAQVDAGLPLLFKIGTRELGLFLDRFILSTDSTLTGAAFNALPNSTNSPNAGFLLSAINTDPQYTHDSRIIFYTPYPNTGGYTPPTHSETKAPMLLVDYVQRSGLAAAILRQPASTTVNEGGPVTFSVSATGVPFLSYQWFRAGAVITDATNAQYTITTVQASDEGATFSVGVTDAKGSVVNSSEATLTVVVDTQAPLLIAAATTNLNTSVMVKFSEPVSAASASVTDNYTLNGGVTVLGAELSADPTIVILTTSPMTPFVTYTLSVKGVQDVSVRGNEVAPNSQTTFIQPVPVAIFPAKNRATCIEWNYTYSEANSAGKLIVGDTSNDTNAIRRVSSLLRFDVYPLKDLYSSINSVTIRLTQKEYTPDRIGGVIEVYRLTAANAGWDNFANFGTSDGGNPWAGGQSGARVPEIDYVTNLLASAPYSNANNAGTVYDVVIPDELATGFIDQWSAEGLNEGFLLKSTPTEPKDSRIIFFPDGPNAPKLLVEYFPVGYTPAPRLAFTRAGAQLTLSWTGTGFVLQENAVLSNSGGWSDVANGNSSPVTVNMAGTGNKFYRLKKL